jgi:hypothetical protein
MSSSFQDIDLVIDDFIKCGWEDAVNSSNEFHKYSLIFYAKSQKEQENGNTSLQIALALLATITYPALNGESKDKPFTPMECIEQIHEKYLDVLRDFVEHINDPQLKARVADIIWIRKKREYKMAQIAIDSYLESATLLEDPMRLSFLLNTVERAIRLAYISNQNSHKQRAIQFINILIDKYNGNDSSFLSGRLINILLDFSKPESYSKYVHLSKKLAKVAEKNSNWEKARESWLLAIKCHKKDKNSHQERKVSENYAETYVKQALSSIRNEPVSYTAASRFLIRAIEAFRNIGNSQNRVQNLHQQLLEYQQKSVGEFLRFTWKKDVSNVAISAMDIVKDKEITQSIKLLALMGKSPCVTCIEEQTQKLINESFTQIFSSFFANEMGKVIGNNPCLEDEMYRYAISLQNSQVQGIIEPARLQINLDHHPRVSDFYLLVADNPFIPRGREEIFARGLHAGLIGDFMTAGHFLIPQIEHSLRCLISRTGAVTSCLNKEGIQDEYNLTPILNDHRADLESILGKDITFDLIGILNRKGFGSNLRNLTAHGLRDSDSFYTTSMIYLWWLTLHLCHLFPLVREQRHQEEPLN